MRQIVVNAGLRVYKVRDRLYRWMRSLVQGEACQRVQPRVTYWRRALQPRPERPAYSSPGPASGRMAPASPWVFSPLVTASPEGAKERNVVAACHAPSGLDDRGLRSQGDVRPRRRRDLRLPWARGSWPFRPTANWQDQCIKPNRSNSRWTVLPGLFLIVFFLVSTRRQASPLEGTQEGATHGRPPTFVLSDAPPLQMPGVEVSKRNLPHESDCNSPIHWDGDTVYAFNSYNHPWRSSGPDLFHLGDRISTQLGGVNDNLAIWIESTWKDDRTRTLYGAYHYEPDAVCFSNKHLPTMPRIGWIRSMDNGKTWEDLGFIIEARPSQVRCDTESPWDAGGTGDFVFVFDEDREYFYFYGTSYDARVEEQGIWAARMRLADRDNPCGKVMKWHNGNWTEPGLWGHITPVFPAERDYHRKDGTMFWGPAIHWNTHLKTYVMLLNHAIDTRLSGDGIYITFNSRLGDPAGWSKPKIILNGNQVQAAMAGANLSTTKMENGWYPQVVGTAKGETDKRVGRTGRLFMAGYSRKEITFFKPGEAPK